MVDIVPAMPWGRVHERKGGCTRVTRVDPARTTVGNLAGAHLLG